MRAPQYGRFKVPVRASQARGCAQAERTGTPAPVVVKAPNKPVRLLLWHKSAKAMLGTGKPDGRKPAKPNKVMTRAQVEPEPDRVLPNGHQKREGYKSRNDRQRIYHTQRGEKVDNG